MSSDTAKERSCPPKPAFGRRRMRPSNRAFRPCVKAGFAQVRYRGQDRNGGVSGAAIDLVEPPGTRLDTEFDHKTFHRSSIRPQAAGSACLDDAASRAL